MIDTLTVTQATRTDKRQATPRPPQSLVDVALAYAARGWLVYPLTKTRTPFGKNRRLTNGTDHFAPECPDRSRCCHGHLDAERAPVKVRALFQRYGARVGGIGVDLARSGLVLVDADRHDDGADGVATLEALEAQNGRLRGSRSWSGGDGRHVYLRVPDGANLRTLTKAASPWPGIDLKVTGGAYLPPSRHPSGRFYRWIEDAPIEDAPSWIVEAMTRPDPVPLPTTPYRPPTSPAGSTRAEGWTRAAVDGVLSDLASAPEGRNDALYIASARLRDLYHDQLPGALDESTAWSELWRACQSNGLAHDPGNGGESACRRTFYSAWRATPSPSRAPTFDDANAEPEPGAPTPEQVRQVVAEDQLRILDDVRALEGVHPAHRPSVARIHASMLAKCHTSGRLTVRVGVHDAGPIGSDCGAATLSRAADALAMLGWRIQWGGPAGDSVTCTEWTYSPPGLSNRLVRCTPPSPMDSYVPNGSKVSAPEVANVLARGLRRADRTAGGETLAGCGAWSWAVVDLALQNPEGIDAETVAAHVGVTVQTARKYLSRMADRGILAVQHRLTGGRPANLYVWTADPSALAGAVRIGERVERNAIANLEANRWRMAEARRMARRQNVTIAAALGQLRARMLTLIRGDLAWGRVRDGGQAPTALSAGREFRQTMERTRSEADRLIQERNASGEWSKTA